mgnify:CR=1 FL=1
MKILHLVGGDLNLGASKGAMILHNGLLKEGVDSHILSDSTLPKNFINGHSIKDNLILRLLNLLFNKFEKMIKFLLNRKITPTFSFGIFGINIKKLKIFKEADIIHIHWLNQGFINLSHLKNCNKAIVWTLRDMWAFTGGCHWSSDCEKYKTGCGACPVLLSKKVKDITTGNQNKKIDFVNSNKNISITAISGWLGKLGESSLVFKNKEILNMGNNVEIEHFFPVDKQKAREKIKIRTQKKILIYGSQNPQAKRKGWDILLQSFKNLDLSKYYLIIFGSFWSHRSLDDLGIEYKSFGYIKDVSMLRHIYSAGDFFLAPAIQDGWPKTFGESLLCQTPVISFKNSAIGDVLTHNETGYIVENYDSNELSNMIKDLSKPSMDTSIVQKNGRNLILNHYSPSSIAKKYISLYKDIYK